MSKDSNLIRSTKSYLSVFILFQWCANCSCRHWISGASFHSWPCSPGPAVACHTDQWHIADFEWVKLVICTFWYSKIQVLIWFVAFIVKHSLIKSRPFFWRRSWGKWLSYCAMKAVGYYNSAFIWYTYRKITLYSVIEDYLVATVSCSKIIFWF